MVTRPIHYNTRYKHDLTPRQRQVLDLIARGYTNSEIAVTLDVSLDGAKWHVSEILAKLGVDTREQAADYWRSYNRPLAKVARAFAGVGGFGGTSLLKIAAATVAVTAVAAAGIAIYAALKDSGPGQDEPGGAAARPCTTDDLKLRVVPAGGGSTPVTITAEAMLARGCELPTEYTLEIADAATGQPAAIQGNPATIPVSMRDSLTPGEWKAISLPARWTNWCGTPTTFEAVARIGSFEARTSLTSMPACQAPSNPSLLSLPATPQPSQPGDDKAPEAARKAAQDLADAIARGDIAAIAGMARPTEYTCPPAPAQADLHPDCTSGQQHALGMISLPYASEASLYPIEQFEPYLRQQITPTLRLKTIGCPASDTTCTSFIAAFEFANAPGTGIFFAFEPWLDGGKTGIFAHGTVGAGLTAPLTGGSMKTILGDTVFTPVDGTPQPVPTPAQPEIPQEVRAFANHLAGLVSAADIAGLMALTAPQAITCPDVTQPGGARGPFPLCDGAATGEVRQGFRITLHGSEGEAFDPAGFEQELRLRVQPTARLASIGCGDGKNCSAGFVVAFERTEQPTVFYFALEYVTKGEPKIVGYGLSGDNADTIVNGGATQSWMGSTVFIPVK